MSVRWAAATDEEEQMALALAISASLSEGNFPQHLQKPSTIQPTGPTTTTRASAPGSYQDPRPNPTMPQRSSAGTGSTGLRPYPAVPYSQPSSPSAYRPGVPHIPALNEILSSTSAFPYVPSSSVPSSSATTPSAPPSPSQRLQPSRLNNVPNNVNIAQKPSTSSPLVKKRTLHTTGCAGCGKPLSLSYLTAMNRKWHAECFTCALCEQPIRSSGSERFIISQVDSLPYHSHCHQIMHNPWCVICGDYITGDQNNIIQYKINPFWKEKYCSHHDGDQTPCCCACSRYQPRGVEYAKLGDGRDICLNCLSTVILDTHDVQPLYDEVLAFYRELGMPLPSRPPLTLVDGPTLNEYGSREGRDPNQAGPMFHVRGLTMATVYTTLPSIVRRRGGLDVSTMQIAAPVTRCQVTGILVMYGLPRLLTASIIAHEVLHAYLRLRNVTGLNSRVEEGLAQLMAYLWLEKETQHIKEEDKEQQTMASYLTYQIREDLSETYGGGFRDALAAFQVVGLKQLVDHVIATGRLD